MQLAVHAAASDLRYFLKLWQVESLSLLSHSCALLKGTLTEMVHYLGKKTVSRKREITL